MVTGKLRQGTPVKILQTTGSWSRIEVPSPPRFWVFGRYVTGAPQGRISADKVRLRTKPTTGSGSSIVAELNKGDAVKVHASSGDWKQVSTEPAIQSWVQSSGLVEQNPVTQSWLDNFNARAGTGNSSPSSASTNPTLSTAQAFKAAWVTSQEAPIVGRPDENAALLNYVEKDTPVKALGSKDAWLMVQVPGGLDVWIYGKFVSEDGAVAKINNNRVRIRSLPSSAPESDILGLLDKGATIKVISRKGDWIRARVLYSVAGWIRKGDTTTPGNISAGWQSSWDAIRSSAQN
jgi:SH3-like domain-containing protein